jgi:hypothetical protein
VDEVSAAYRTDLAVAKETRTGVLPEQFVEGLGIVMTLPEEVASAACAGKDERCKWAQPTSRDIDEHLPKVRIGTRPVPQLELKRLSNPGQCAYRQDPGLRIAAD